MVTGLIDAISILGLGRVFVANMTGNVVFVGFALAGAPGFSLAGSPACGIRAPTRSPLSGSASTAADQPAASLRAPSSTTKVRSVKTRTSA